MDKSITRHTLRTYDNLMSVISVMCMLLNCGRKLWYPERTLRGSEHVDYTERGLNIRNI